jgi:hypothetical protein
MMTSVGAAFLAGVIAGYGIAVPVGAIAVLIVGLTARTAIRHHRDPVGRRSADGLATPVRAYLGLLALTLLNPATVVYFAALVLGGGAGDGGAAFVLGALLASASCQLLVASGGSLVGWVLTGGRGRLTTALVGTIRSSITSGSVRVIGRSSHR